MDNISAVVRDTRKSLSLTQGELAERAGVSQRLVSELERGATGASFAKVFAVFSALDLSLEARPVTPSNPRGEVDRLVAEVAKRSLGQVPARPKLSTFLEG